MATPEENVRARNQRLLLFVQGQRSQAEGDEAVGWQLVARHIRSSQREPEKDVAAELRNAIPIMTRTASHARYFQSIWPTLERFLEALGAPGDQKKLWLDWIARTHEALAIQQSQLRQLAPEGLRAHPQLDSMDRSFQRLLQELGELSAFSNRRMATDGALVPIVHIDRRVELVRALRRAVEWLDAEQPEGAVVDHLGIWCVETFGHLHVSLAPHGAGGRPVFVFELRYDVEEAPQGAERFLTDFDVALLREIVEGLVGGPDQIATDWNGVGCNSYSIALRRDTSPSLFAASRNYGAFTSQDREIWGPSVKAGAALAVKPEGWR